MPFTLPIKTDSFMIDDERHPYEQEITITCELRKSDGRIEWSVTVESDRDGGVGFGQGETMDDTIAMFEPMLDSFAGGTSDYLKERAIDTIRQRTQYYGFHFASTVKNA